MKKLLSITILFCLISSVLSACQQNMQNESNMTESTDYSTENTEEYQSHTEESENVVDYYPTYPYYYYNYDDLFKAFSLTEEPNPLQEDKQRHGGRCSSQFITAMTLRGKIEVPRIDGEFMPVKRIEYWSHSYYPWLIYNCIVSSNDQEYDVKIVAHHPYAGTDYTVPSKGLSLCMLIPTYNGLYDERIMIVDLAGTDDEEYGNAYKDVQLRNEATRVYSKMFVDPSIDKAEVIIFTGGWVLMMTAPREILTDEFWSTFSFE